MSDRAIIISCLVGVILGAVTETWWVMACGSALLAAISVSLSCLATTLREEIAELKAKQP